MTSLVAQLNAAAKAGRLTKLNLCRYDDGRFQASLECRQGWRVHVAKDPVEAIMHVLSDDLSLTLDIQGRRVDPETGFRTPTTPGIQRKTDTDRPTVVPDQCVGFEITPKAVRPSIEELLG